MMKIAAAGSLDYFKRGVSFLRENGYDPRVTIERSHRGGETIDDKREELRREGIDLLVCMAYPDILTNEQIDLFPKGCINVHSGLPRYRGRHPLPWMLIAGEPKVPVSVHFMDKEIDTGDVIVEDYIRTTRNETYATLLDKVTRLEQELLLTAVRQIDSGTVYRRKQDPSELKYTRRRTPADSEINLTGGSIEVHRFVNALSGPVPHAFGFVGEKQVEITYSDSGEGPGKILTKTLDGRYVLSTGNGVVLVQLDSDLPIGAQFKLLGDTK